MQKYLPTIAGILLGLCFLAASVPVLFNLITMPKLPEGTPAAHFMAAFVPTGYVKFVKMFEFTGGIIVMIPRLRNIGLLLLGPVIVNIFAYHSLIDDPRQMLQSNADHHRRLRAVPAVEREEEVRRFAELKPTKPKDLCCRFFLPSRSSRF